MHTTLNIDDILAPIPGDNPAGTDLRYDEVYDEIKEARKADDDLDRGDWQRDLKSAEWNKVVKLSADALAHQSKDLQLAIWLTEGLVKVDGFAGLAVGLQIINGLLQNFWATLYPEIEDGDLDYRAGRLTFLNEKLWLAIKQIPLTDKSKAAEYSWLHWQESRQVGYEKELISADGEVDEKRQKKRAEAIAEGKVAPEEFDKALSLTGEDFSRNQLQALQEAQQQFLQLDDLIDKQFGNQGPSLAQLLETLKDCEQFFNRLFKDKGWRLDDEENVPEPLPENSVNIETPVTEAVKEPPVSTPTDSAIKQKPQQNTPPPVSGHEETVWSEALTLLRSNDLDTALALLFEASCSAQSIRQKHRYRLFMAKLCLKANRVDLAKPILEELNILVDELQLVRWESDTWVGEVIEGLYLCLSNTDERFQDLDRAAELLKKLCTTDVTIAMKYRS